MDRIDRIREAERNSHSQFYQNHPIFEKGSWLERPVRTVVDTWELLCGKKELRALDLGCGVGRNCIPLAKRFSDISCRVDCVDLLPEAIRLLKGNAEAAGVAGLYPYVSTIEEYIIEKNCYDFIMAVSALEHVADWTHFLIKLEEIKEGICGEGVVCLIINSQIQERDVLTGVIREPQFEVNVPTKVLEDVLGKIFFGWKILKHTVSDQSYQIDRENGNTELTTSVLTWVVQKIDS